MYVGMRARLVHEVDNFTAMCGPIV
jgi:hypothetical protein